MQIDILNIPREGKEISYQEDPLAVGLSPELELKGNIDIHLYLYKTGKTVVVKGTIEATPILECGRCTINFYLPLSFEFDQVFVPKVQSRPPVYHKTDDEKRRNRASHSGKSDSFEANPEEETDHLDDICYFEGSSICLDEIIREQVLLALPMRPLCSPACKGLCPICRADLNVSPCACPKEENNHSMKKVFYQELRRKKGE